MIKKTQSLETEPAGPAEPSGSVFRPAALLMVGRFLAFGVTALVPLVLVRVLDQHDFGTYKQVLLISSSIYFIGQFGVATSLFYFLPKASAVAGRHVCNASVFLAGMGLVSAVTLGVARWRIAEWLNNPALAPYLLWTGIYAAFLMAAATLEIVMICREQYLKASAAYALSDTVRAACFLMPVLLGWGLSGLLLGAVTVGGVRLLATLVYFRRAYGKGLAPDPGLFKTQLAYAVPFGSAVLLEVLEGNFHQYFVSSRFDAATFAIYAAGCLQIPFVDFVAVPTGDVMMVKMREALARGKAKAALAIWLETTRKLALIFFPMVALSLVVARELIVTLYTDAYAASVPIFMVWTLAILFSAVLVDGVMRVYAQTRFLFINSLVKLCLTVALVGWFVSFLDLVGAVAITLLATLVAKTASLARMKRLMGIRWSEVLPWGALLGLAGAAAVAGIPAILVKTSFTGAPAAALLASGFIYTVSYSVILLGGGLLTVSERIALTGWLRRARTQTGEVA